MSLIYDQDNGGFYWRLFDDGANLKSQIFGSKAEALIAKWEDLIEWN